MPVKTVNLKDFAKELGTFTDERIEQLKRATINGVAKGVPVLVRESPVDTGLYAASWDFTFEEKEEFFRVFLGNTAPHAPIIEHGARPHRPPLGPLLAWAKRVLQDPSQPPNYSDQVWGLALGVQRKIEREGQAPKHILEQNIPRIIDSIRQEYEKIG